MVEEDLWSILSVSHLWRLLFPKIQISICMWLIIIQNRYQFISQNMIRNWKRSPQFIIVLLLRKERRWRIIEQLSFFITLLSIRLIIIWFQVFKMRFGQFSVLRELSTILIIIFQLDMSLKIIHFLDFNFILRKFYKRLFWRLN